jgi:hypothetical protein
LLIVLSFLFPATENSLELKLSIILLNIPIYNILKKS